MRLKCFSNTINPINLVSFLIGYSGLMIYFSWDDNFNMQVIFPIMIVVIGSFLYKNDFHVPYVSDFKYFASILAAYFISLLSGFVFNNDAINELALVRTIYSGLILLYYVVAVNFCIDNRFVKTIISGNLLAGTLTAVLVIKNWLAGAGGKVSLLNYWGNAVEENYTAAFVAFTTILCLVIYFTSNDYRIKFIAFCSASINTFAIFLTGSRAAFVALIMSSLVLLIIYIFTDKTSINKKIFIICVSILLGIYFITNILNILPEFIYNRLFINSLNDNSNRERIMLWSLALEGFLYRPIFGYGAGVFSYYVQKEFPHHIVVVAHNTLIDFLVDFGIIGIALLTLLFYKNIYVCFTKRGFFLFPLLICWFITSFIVGGERTFFFWNGLITITILCKFVKQSKEGLITIWNKK